MKTGIQNNYNILDPRLRGGDGLKLLHGISETQYQIAGDSSALPQNDEVKLLLDSDISFEKNSNQVKVDFLPGR